MLDIYLLAFEWQAFCIYAEKITMQVSMLFYHLYKIEKLSNVSQI